MTLLLEDVVKLVLAILVGGLIGAEREYRDKSAGFRTLIFICIGATLFTNFSLKLGAEEDPVRIAASIVSGVGFLGAGAIMRGSKHIAGLTTASTIWLTAALGMGIGGGYYLVSGVGTLVALIVLWVFPGLESWIDKVHDARSYRIVCPVDEAKFKTIEQLFLGSELRVKRVKRTKSEEGLLCCTWQASGKPEKHERLIAQLLTHADVKVLEI